MSVPKTQDEAFTPKYATPERFEWAPKLPLDRPPTRREVWAHYHAVFYDFKGHKPMPGCDHKCLHTPEGELEVYCRDAWAWKYIAYVLKLWDKHPDWDGEEPVIPEAVLTIPMLAPGDWSANLRAVYDRLEIACQLRQRRAA